jgi:predicted aspartyl protease
VAVGWTLAVSTPETTPFVPDLVEDGERHFRAALFEPAERLFRGVLAHDAQSAPGHLGLALTLLARGELAQAQGEAEVAVHLSTAPALAHLALALVREQAGDITGAVTALDQYLAAAPGDEHPVRRQRTESQRSLLALAGAAPLRTLDRQAQGKISFDVVEDKVVLKASVNGRIPIDVVLDTGAEHLVLSERTVERAGVLRARARGAGRGPEMALAESFDVAGVSVRRVPAIVRREPLRVVPNRPGDAFSPIALGLSVIIDYERRELTVAARLPFEAADVELPLHVLGLPVVAGASGGESVGFVVDTGSEVTAVSTGTLERASPAPHARRIPLRLFDVWGMQQPDAFLLTPGIDLAFGAIRLNQYPVVVRSWPDVRAVHGFEMGGILGHNFLRRYRVTIDLARRVLRLKRQLPDRPTDAPRSLLRQPSPF